jgi:hypothetical protein
LTAWDALECERHARSKTAKFRLLYVVTLPIPTVPAMSGQLRPDTLVELVVPFRSEGLATHPWWRGQPFAIGPASGHRREQACSRRESWAARH